MDNFEFAVHKNFGRLSGPPYTIDQVFRPAEYDWPGDWEGRALLAFAMHARLNGGKIPCMEQLIAALPEKTNGRGHFGAPFSPGRIDEQQLAGHNWFLRGLLAYAELPEAERRDEARRFAKETVENLFLPALENYGNYPVRRDKAAGGVSGNRSAVNDGWWLSTDVGCAFIPLDGLAEYYAATKDESVGAGISSAAERFGGLDFLGLKMQTHATLSALRGILSFYETTREKKYLELVLETFGLYLKNGMTLTYENFNWFGREDTWTEPCAVVDSLILAIRLFKITADTKYEQLARRIWFNGLRFCQRSNGGAGPNSCVTKARPLLRVSMYEAPFCCTMRYAEGLRYVAENKAMFARRDGEISCEDGRFYRDDRLLVKDESGTFKESETVLVKGKALIELPTLNRTPEAEAKNAVLRVWFED